ncbi:hypothetical protein D3C85_810110 [compost metagenome]
MTAAQRQHRLAQVGQARWLARLLIVGEAMVFPLVTNVGARACARGQKAFGNQLVEGIEDGDPRQRQFLAQGPGRWQAHAPLKSSGQYLFANLQIELAVERNGTGPVQIDARQQQAGRGFHDRLVWMA